MEIKDKELHRIATTAIIYDGKGKYLVTKRSAFKKVHPNKWTVPGGGVNVDDYMHGPQTHGNAGWYHAIEKGLAREIQEEVGVQVGTPEYLLNLTFIRPDGVPVLVLSYFAKYEGGEVKLDADAVEFAWITAEEAKTYDLIPGIAEEIMDVEAILKKRAA
jgi:8-oxo-dGTP pyrophosphatase MutT (NUDIX family)